MNYRRQRGLATLEFILTVAMLLATVSISSDLYLLNQARGNDERVAHNLSSILASQAHLTATAIDQLIARAMPASDLQQYELIFYKVTLDRTMDWQPLVRGTDTGLCTPMNTGLKFSGDFPQADDEIDNQSILVVQLCRETGTLTSFSSLLTNQVMTSLAYSRMRYHEISLDDELKQELGVEDDE